MKLFEIFGIGFGEKNPAQKIAKCKELLMQFGSYKHLQHTHRGYRDACEVYDICVKDYTKLSVAVSNDEVDDAVIQKIDELLHDLKEINKVGFQ